MSSPDAARTPALAELLAPMDVETFLHRHWQRTPLHLGGRSGRFADVGLDQGAFFEAAGLPGVKAKASYRDARDQHVELDGVAPRQVRALFDAGLNVVLGNLHRGVPALGERAQRLRSELGLTGTVSINGYLSPTGRGSGLHFDDHAVFNLQVEGTKRWRFGGAPAVPFPPRNLGLTDADLQDFAFSHPWTELEPPSPGSLQEVTLVPGDVLFLPAGTWHDAAAVGGPSLAITIACAPLRFGALLARALDHALERDLRWREPVPPSIGAGRRRGGPSGYFTSQLELVREAVARLTPADLELAWRKDLADFESNVRPPVADRATPVLTGTRLRTTDPLAVVEGPDEAGEPSLHLFAGNRMAIVSVQAAPLVAWLTTVETFEAREALAHAGPGAAWAGVAAVLAELERLGMVERVEPAGFTGEA